MRYDLARPLRLDLEAFAQRAGVHPELVARLVDLGLLDAIEDSAGRLWFDPGQGPAVARVQRLRAGLGVNYAAMGLVLDLLDRIATLETALRTRQVHPGGPPWT